MIALRRAREKDVNSWHPPDWTNPKFYPKSDNALSDDAWRWEFLRRDKNYQRDFIERPSSFAFDYGLLNWISPAQNDPPEFAPSGGHVVKFKEKPVDQYLQYQAWVTSLSLCRFFLFSVDVEHSFKSQTEIMKAEYDRLTKIYFCCKEKKINTTRKNNKTPKNMRPRPYLLRVLDAANANVSPDDIGSVLSQEGMEAVEENSIRRAITFAQDFWKRF